MHNVNKLIGQALQMAFRAIVEPALRRAKIRAVIWYVELVQSARESAVVFVTLAFCVVLMAGGAILIPVALCLFMPWQPLTKALVGCTVGAIYLFVPLVVVVVLMSEKRWMRMSRADVMVKDVLKTQ